MISILRRLADEAKRKGSSVWLVPWRSPTCVEVPVLTASPTPRGGRRYRGEAAEGRALRRSLTSRVAHADIVARLSLRHSWTHPEGWRDWPYETPATTVTSQREGANSRQMCGGLFALRHTG